MQRRKIGNVKVTNDDNQIIFSAQMWANVWSYDKKIWFGAFFNTNHSDLFDRYTPQLINLGFKKKEIFSEYGNYYKFQIVGMQKTFQDLLNNMNNASLDVALHTSNGLCYYNLKIEITKDANYVYNEKVIDAI